MKKRLCEVLFLYVFCGIVILSELLPQNNRYYNNLQDAASFSFDEAYVYATFQDKKTAKIGNAIPAPREWKQQVFAGRSAVQTLCFEPESFFADFISPECGWVIVTYTRGIGASDIYIYRTQDAGKTWLEVNSPDIFWFPSAISIIDAHHLIIASEKFDVAPVYITHDGGNSWVEIDLPYEGSVVKAISVIGGQIKMIVFRNSQKYELTSFDFGNTWEIL